MELKTEQQITQLINPFTPKPAILSILLVNGEPPGVNGLNISILTEYE